MCLLDQVTTGIPGAEEGFIPISSPAQNIEIPADDFRQHPQPQEGALFPVQTPVFYTKWHCHNTIQQDSLTTRYNNILSPRDLYEFVGAKRFS